MASDNPIKTLIFVFVALIYIFILGVLGASFGGVAEQVANQGINSIVLLVAFVLAIPPIGFIIWIITRAR